MAEIAVALDEALRRRERLGVAGKARARLVARGSGFCVDDVLCTSGPSDRPFEERHSRASIALVVAGSFEYRSDAGRELLAPGALLLGNPGRPFECSHVHGAGDRCLAFRFEPGWLSGLAADAGVRGARAEFGLVRLPPLRELSPLAARACAGLLGAPSVSWQELALELAGRVLALAGDARRDAFEAPPSSVARVTRALRALEARPAEDWTLAALAREARLSPYHFLRTFERLTGVTPHQYVLRKRLRTVAARLPLERGRVLDLALDAGFGDISNFNRAFRAEFGVSPREYRARAG